MRSVVEWVLAVAVLLGVVWLGAPVVMQWVPEVSTPANTDEPAVADAPEGIPSSATGVPLLLLLDGSEIRVGDTVAQVRRVAPVRRATGAARVLAGPFGEKVVRAYQVQGTRFWLVVEPSMPGGEPKVTGIFLP